MSPWGHPYQNGGRPAPKRYFGLSALQFDLAFLAVLAAVVAAVLFPAGGLGEVQQLTGLDRGGPDQVKGTEPTNAEGSSFNSAGCRFSVPLEYNVDCGFLVVPEDHARPDGATIRLHVAIFRSRSPNPAPDPVVYLEGGPGGKALENASFALRGWFDPFLQTRDFIIFDQRGAGYSQPALDCPEITRVAFETIEKHVSAAEEAKLNLDAATACYERLRDANVSFAAYDTEQNAADLEDLRVALGYQQWNLYGVSYGTKLALEAMRDFPGGIRSVILDSPYPLQVNLYEELVPNAGRSFHVLFSHCAADAECGALYPDLEDIFFDLVERLNKDPITVPVQDPRTLHTYQAVISGRSLIGIVFSSLYVTDLIPAIPSIIYDSYGGDYLKLALLMSPYLANLDSISMGMHLSVQCGEEAQSTSPDKVRAVDEQHPRIADAFAVPLTLDICDVWKTGAGGKLDDEPITSSLPTLVLSGEFDPITPPEWARTVNADLTASHLFEFPQSGHAVSAGEGCPLTIVLLFLQAPAERPKAACDV